MRRGPGWKWRLAAIGALAAASGCNVAVIAGLGVLAAQSSASRHGGSSTPTPVSVETPTTVLVDRAEIRYALHATGAAAFDVRVEYSTVGSAGPFQLATEAIGPPSQGTHSLTASAEGTPHVFVWNSFFDLDAAGFVHGSDVVIRITALTPSLGSPVGLPATTSPFAVDERLIATVAGSPAADGERIAAELVPAFQPTAAIVTSAGVLVADTGNARVRLIDGTTNLVTTFAGSSRPGFGGDGGPGPGALLLGPGALAVDSAGNVLIADAGNNRVRRVDASGIISTIAGIGSAGYSGDGGPASQAALTAPSGLAVDSAGAIVIADTGNNRIRSVTPGGTISTIAGTGVAGPLGDGGAGSAAQLSSPSALAFDADGALLIADTGNHAVRRLVIGGPLTTIAGTLGVAGLGAEDILATVSPLRAPAGLTLVNGAVSVSDSGNNRVRRFVEGGKIETVAGDLDGNAGFAGDGGLAAGALLAAPSGLASDGAGGLLVADTANNRIRKIDSTGLVTTILGSGATDAASVGDGRVATQGRLFGPWQVSLGAGAVFVADGDGNRARRFTVGGAIATIAGNGGSGLGADGNPAVETPVFPRGIAVDANGIVFIAEGDPNNRVCAINPTTGIIQSVAGMGTGPDGAALEAALIDPEALLALPGGVALLVSEFEGGSRIREITYSADGAGNVTNATIATVCGTGTAGFAGDGGPATQAQLSVVGGMDVDALGQIDLADQGGTCVRRFTIGGTIATVAGTPTASGFGGDGGPATRALFNGVQFVAIDRTSGMIYVADHANHRVRAFTDGGLIETVAGDGTVGESGLGGPALHAQLASPLGIAVGADGSVFVGSTGTRRIYAFKPGGTIDAVAGLPSSDVAGDGGPATAAVVNQPFPAIGADGTLYIGERNFGRIRRVESKTGLISTVTGKGILSVEGNGGPIADAFIDECWGLSIDASGALILSEKEASPPMVRKIDFVQGTISALAGGGTGPFGSGDGGPATSASLSGPEGTAVSATGDVYVTDSDLGVVRRVDPSGTITTVAGGGTSTADGVLAVNAVLESPCALAVGPGEIVFVAQRAPSSIVRRFTVGGTVATVAGIPRSSGFNGDEVRATDALLNDPQGVALDGSGNVFIADSQNHRVRRVDPQGFISTVAGTGEAGSGPDGVPAASSKLNGPRQIRVDARGNIFVGEEFGNRVRRFRVFP